MLDRRALIAAGLAAALPAGARARTPAEDDAPPEVVIGRPSRMDYGDGVLVPLTTDAFATLWETSTHWMTFGLGIGMAEPVARIRSAKGATLTMELLLANLALTPERLVKADGGWRVKDGRLDDLTMAQVPLPGKPGRPNGGRFTSGSEFASVFPAGTTIGPDALNGFNGLPNDLGGTTSYFAVTRYRVAKAEMPLERVGRIARVAPTRRPKRPD